MAIQPTDPIAKLLRRQAVSVDRRATMRAVAEVMVNENVSAVVVLGAEGVVGIVSESDVVWALASGADPDKTYVNDSMTEYPMCVASDEPVVHVARTMAYLGVRHLPVVSTGEPIGMTSAPEVLEALVSG